MNENTLTKGRQLDKSEMKNRDTGYKWARFETVSKESRENTRQEILRKMYMDSLNSLVTSNNINNINSIKISVNMEYCIVCFRPDA